MTDTLRSRLLAAYADEHRDHLAALRTVLAAGGGDLEEAYRHAHSLKGAARAVELPRAVELAHQLESLLDEWLATGTPPDPAALGQARAAIDIIEDVSAAALAGGAEVPTAPEPPESAATLRVETGTVDRLTLSTARLLAELERRRAELALLRQALALSTSLPGGAADAVHRLEDGEWALARAGEALAEDVARLRLVTAEEALGHFGPMVRALAAELGKDVRYDAHGLATQADREVLTAVAEPVMHLLRNAIAHGIESPAERLAAGKDPAGRLTLAVAVSGARLELRVCDDGAGIPVRRLADEAVARGVLGAEQVARSSPDRLRQLVFHPRLSTAGSLSTTAGRGMGMAIVHRVIERLQGQVELLERAGGGTEVLIRLPVGVLAQRIVLVQAGASLFGLPAAAVVRVAESAATDMRMVDGRAVLLVDDAELPVVDLAVQLGLAAGGRRLRARFLVILMRVASEVVALTVDAVADVRDLWVSPLDDELVDDPRLAGTVTLEGGVLVLVLSPAGLGAVGAAAAPPPRPVEGRPSPLVLVVDDSPTIRALERAILEANSYRVEVAVDGQDALDRMLGFLPDVVVSDIEMPRLDGLGLLATMRADPRLAPVPVVLVTSCAGEADRKAGMALGAAAYLVKTRFDQREFLDTIERLASFSTPSSG
ncbi:MAG: response regulator [Bacteroidales bacterium]